jgi:hypothetical protein
MSGQPCFHTKREAGPLHQGRELCAQTWTWTAGYAFFGELSNGKDALPQSVSRSRSVWSAPHSGAFDWVRQQAHHRLKIWGDSVQAFESRLRLLGPEQVLARG